MKAAARFKWPPPTPSPVELAISSCEPGRRIIVPQNAAEVKPKDLRDVYEKMRKLIYGGGTRIELQKIYYRGSGHVKGEGQGERQGERQGEGEGSLMCIGNKVNCHREYPASLT